MSSYGTRSSRFAPKRLRMAGMRAGIFKGAAMEHTWLISALWIGLALISAMISIRIGISVALVEIVVGSFGGNLLGITCSRPSIF
jgi:hypothetical protein